MASASDYLETLILDTITGNDAYVYSPLYMALFTDVATAEDLEQGILTNEVSGTNYQRKTVIFEPAVQNQTVNTGDVIFDQAGVGGWGNLKYCAVMDSFGNGNILFHGLLSSEQDITDGDTFKFSSSNITITVT